MPRFRVPPAVGPINVNGCKNPACANFLVPPTEDRGDPCYRLSGGGRSAVLICKACGEFPPLKSNLAVMQELSQIMTPLLPDAPLACPDRGCENHCVPVTTPGAYHRWTATPVSPRYKCLACKTVFAIRTEAATRTTDLALEGYVLRSLVNKVVLRRISKIFKVSRGKIHESIGRFAAQARSFVAERERTLLQARTLGRLTLQCDSQDYLVNWSDSGDTRNVQLSAFGACDAASGYVFAMRLNYDPTLDPNEVEADAAACGDLDKGMPEAQRRWARVWLKKDYERAAARQNQRRKSAVRKVSDGRTRRNVVMNRVAENYKKREGREDVDREEEHDADSQLPGIGMQVKKEYVAYAVMRYLDDLLASAEQVDFCFDQESTIRSAYMAAFAPRIRAGTSHAQFVSINKEWKNEDRKAESARARKLVRTRMEAEPRKTREEVMNDILKERMSELTPIGAWSDRWILHPFPDASEPEKAMSLLTETVKGRPDLTMDERADLYRVASLHALDRFFECVRRSITLLERPIATSSNNRRVWHGYAAYQPRVIVDMLTLYRCQYNYCEVGEDGCTPAMRFGLADRVYSEEEIVAYVPPERAALRLLKAA